jgi:hypothetical protein
VEGLLPCRLQVTLCFAVLRVQFPCWIETDVIVVVHEWCIEY